MQDCFAGEQVQNRSQMQGIRLDACRSDGCCRVEVFYHDEWGTVCDDGWGNTDTEVVCHQMGCVGGSSISRFGGGSGPIWMDDVGCNGSEASLASCRFNGWANHSCGHDEDVGVCCTDCKVVAGRQMKPGYESAGWLVQDGLTDDFGLPRLTRTISACGLPTSTVKLSLPALTTCAGASYKQQSIDRCRETVCMRGRVSVLVHVCVTVSVCVCVKERERVRLSLSLSL